MPLQTAYGAAQGNFIASLLDSQKACTVLTSDSAANIAFYRRNHRYNRADAMALTYPTISALLGDDFFRAMALFYLEQTPAHSANLIDDGAPFADFIEQFPPAMPYPYLPDCARLDWARHRAHFAVNTPALTAQQFIDIVGDSSHLPNLRLHFHPSVHLLQSSWSVDSIWRMHHGGGTPADWQQAQNVLLWRKPQLGEESQCLGAGDATVLAALLAGELIGHAISLSEAHFDLSGYLKFFLQSQLITGAELID